MNKCRYFLIPLLALCAGLSAQQVFTLDSLRASALRENKTLAIARVGMQRASHQHDAAQTAYLPKISATLGYMRTGEEISLLSDEQRNGLSSLGTTVSNQLSGIAGQIVSKYPDLAPLMQGLGSALPGLGSALNAAGTELADAFRTDTRNMAGGALLLTQPLFTGGKIRALNRITHYAETVAAEQYRADCSDVVLQTDQAYWQVVSLAGKRRLAESYRDMLLRLHDDVQRMEKAGVATHANVLTVSVELGEAEMTLSKVEDALTLSRMLLCRICGLPLDAEPVLTDELALMKSMDGGNAAEESEGEEGLELQNAAEAARSVARSDRRPEVVQLQAATKISEEKVKAARAEAMPQLALMGALFTTYPSLTNGFEKKFRGNWAVGLTLSVPVWNWGETKYKVRTAKADALIAQYRLEEAREGIELQVTQSAQRVNESVKQLRLSRTNQKRAEENLRTARLGFAEGVIPTSDVLAAQTAWLQAHSNHIDAQIGVKLARATLRKNMGETPLP